MDVNDFCIKRWHPREVSSKIDDDNVQLGNHYAFSTTKLCP